MKKYSGFGIVWDPEHNRPLVDFTFDGTGTVTTDDSRVIGILDGLGYKGEDIAEPAQAKSIDKMTADELKAYAAENEIDITGITGKADILARIKEVEGGK